MRVKQVDHLLDLFELFARDKAPLTLTELSHALDMPKSSTFNLIDTLVARGFLYETRQRGGYYPTRRIQEIASEIMEGDTVLDNIHGELERLAESTGETTVLAVRKGDQVLYVDVVEAASPIRYTARVGDLRPLYSTSTGKAILTTYEPDERRSIAEGLVYVAYQKNTMTSAAELLAELEACLKRGWCEDRAELMADVMAFGVPLLLGGRRFGLAVAGPIYRVRPQRAEIAGRLRQAAARIQSVFYGRDPEGGRLEAGLSPTAPARPTARS